MFVKNKRASLSIVFVIFAVLLTFLYYFYTSWQSYLDETKQLATTLNHAVNQTITAHYEVHSEEIDANANIAMFMPLLTQMHLNSEAGYYLSQSNHFVSFGESLVEDNYTKIQENYASWKADSAVTAFGSMSYKGDTIYTYEPIRLSGETIGYTWTAVAYSSFWHYFQHDFQLLALLAVGLALIVLTTVRVVYKSYVNKIKQFKKVIRYSNIIPAHELNIPCELIPIYEEINVTRAEIVESERRFRDVVTAFQEFVWEIDLAGHYTYVSEKIERVLGYAPHTMVGKSVFELMGAPYEALNREAYRKYRHEQTAFRNLEYTQLHQNGSLVYLCANGIPMFDEEHRLIGYRGATRDITDEKKKEQEIQFLAFYDSLTQLPNRTSLVANLEEKLALAEPFALVFIDLDQFKTINDSLSHTTGDELLKITAQVLSVSLQQSDSVFRFGGDEFVIVFSNIVHVQDVKMRIHTVLENLQAPLEIEGHHLFNTASIGVSLYPEHGQTIDQLIRCADIAMYKSKQSGRNQVTVYSEDFQENLKENFELAHDLKEAIGTDQLFLVYQPQIDLENNQIVGVEALLRWIHPQKGFIPPDKFIKIAEEHGSILPLGKWVIEQACRHRKQWLLQGLDHFKTAINISIKQFEQCDFVDQVLAALKKYDLHSKYIELEITEGVAMNDPALVIEKLKILKAHNIYISIDDFGMGYSSLNYLKNLPINRLKIDRAFIKDIHNENDFAIVQSIIAMSKSLQLEVIAEGVETKEHAEVLRGLQCDIAQGYYYFKPMPEDQLLNSLESA